jgi:hypothetical protein
VRAGKSKRFLNIKDLFLYHDTNLRLRGDAGLPRTDAKGRLLAYVHERDDKIEKNPNTRLSCGL